MRITSRLPTERGPQIMATAAKHFSHKVEVEQDDTSARIAFPAGLGLMTSDAGGIDLVIEAADADQAERVRGVLESHLLRFAHRDEPKPLVWTAG